MHILVTNDDGPPSPTSSPYVHSLVRALQRAGHVVSVCLPHTQRSWIGKAHMIGETVKPTYYRPSATFDPTPRSDSDAPSTAPQGTTHTRPVKSSGVEEWILVDGTPASCAQIGLHHFFAEKGPVDLVVSGPNYGRNTTAVFALSSGTLGGALEAAVCKKKAIALSYAFFSRNHDPAIIEGASAHSVKVIESLYKQWPGDGSVDVYTVNVPLVEGVGEHKTIFTAMLQNYWGSGSCFQEVEGSVGDEGEEESRIREGEGQSETQPAAGGQDDSTGYPHRHFKWAPRFTDVYQSVENAPPGNDGWAVKEGLTSITPLKANFWHTATELHGQELKLDTKDSQPTGAMGHGELSLPRRPKNHFYALVAYEDPYVQPLILSALAKVMPPESYTLLDLPSAGTAPSPHAQPDSDAPSEISLPSLLPAGAASDTRILQITPYEQVDWSYVADHEETVLVNSYMLRKALIRKHYLGATIEGWVAKRPDSILKTHFKRGEAFEVDYAEFLDDALVEAFDLRASLEANEGKEEAKDREWWILKPGMSDRGQGIRLFSTMEELQAIFDGWEEDMPDSDEEEEEEEDDNDEDGEAHAAANGNGRGAAAAAAEDGDGGGDYITTSHLRHFVAQPYLHPPLLLAGHGNRKFHIRTYVACVGSLDVYVYREMLALFAGKPYVAPWETPDGNGGGDGEGRDVVVDLEAHLTNTCLQRSVQDGSVRRFWDIDLPDKEDAAAAGSPAAAAKEAIFEQICAVTGEVFEAAARGMLMHFQPLPNAFEVFGLDFLVDAAGRAWLLEVNAFPDFKQTGDDLQGLVAELWEGVLRLAVRRRFAGEAGEDRPPRQSEGGGGGGGGGDNMVHVRHVDLGRRFG